MGVVVSCLWKSPVIMLGRHLRFYNYNCNLLDKRSLIGCDYKLDSGYRCPLLSFFMCFFPQGSLLSIAFVLAIQLISVACATPIWDLADGARVVKSVVTSIDKWYELEIEHL
jgi:hypothetical protein